MSDLTKIDINLIGLGNALMNKKLSVPTYQRSYSWEEKQVNDLLLDISNAIDNDEPEYFIGSIVTTKNASQRPEVVDGQQRLATITIILTAIRDYFYQVSDNERADEINSTYLLTKDLKTLELIPRLQLNSSDHDFFIKSILSKPNSVERKNVTAQKGSHERLSIAYQLANKHINKLASIYKPTEHLIKWVEYIETNLKVIWVCVADDSNAFTIFETLNDRGLALAITDLLKNYLFGLSSDRIIEVQQNWIEMFSTLEAISDEETTLTFIKHYWSSRYGITREKEIYSEIKKKITAKTKAIEFCSELNSNSKLYSAMLNTQHEFWAKYSNTARQYMLTLNNLGMIQIRPLVLSVLANFQPNEVEKALKIMVSWSVRFLICGGLGGGILERHYCEKSKDINNKNIKVTKELLENMADIVPNDSLFKTSFQTATVSKNPLARYYLRVLENEARGDKNPELVPNENQDIVNLEHILPQKLNQNWSNFLPEDHQAYYKRIGNLTLLKTKVNSDLSDANFNDKKIVYINSDFTITKSLSNKTQWNKIDIEERQNYLSELALKAWPNKI